MTQLHVHCELQSLFEQKVITMDEKIDSLKENMDLKFQGLKAEITSGNEMIMLKMQEFIDKKVEKVEKATLEKIDKVEEDAKFSAWVGNNPKLAILFLVAFIVGVYALIQTGLLIKLLHIFGT